MDPEDVRLSLELAVKRANAESTGMSARQVCMDAEVFLAFLAGDHIPKSEEA